MGRQDITGGERRKAHSDQGSDRRDKSIDHNRYMVSGSCQKYTCHSGDVKTSDLGQHIHRV